MQVKSAGFEKITTTLNSVVVIRLENRNLISECFSSSFRR